MRQLELSLVAKVSKKGSGDEFYIGSTDVPVSVDLSKVTFVVFHPEEGSDRATLIIKPRKPREHWKDERNLGRYSTE